MGDDPTDELFDGRRLDARSEGAPQLFEPRERRTYGHIAYEAFAAAHKARKERTSATFYAPWETLSDEIRAAWNAAAQNAINAAVSDGGERAIFEPSPLGAAINESIQEQIADGEQAIDLLRRVRHAARRAPRVAGMGEIDETISESLAALDEIRAMVCGEIDDDDEIDRDDEPPYEPPRFHPCADDDPDGIEEEDADTIERAALVIAAVVSCVDAGIRFLGSCRGSLLPAFERRRIEARDHFARLYIRERDRNRTETW